MDNDSTLATRHAGPARAVRIRARRAEDIGACIAVLARVHAVNGYPMHWPADPPAWLTPHNVVAAWVAEDENSLLGHIALCDAVSDSAAHIWSAAYDLPAERIGVIAKLFVAPNTRGRGVGAALLAEARAEATTRTLCPALEVLGTDRDAIALYERMGWRRVTSVPAPWAHTSEGLAILHYYIAPG